MYQRLRGKCVLTRHSCIQKQCHYRITLSRNLLQKLYRTPAKRLIAMPDAIGHHQRRGYIDQKNINRVPAQTFIRALTSRTESKMGCPISRQRLVKHFPQLLKSVGLYYPADKSRVIGNKTGKECDASVREIMRTHPRHLPAQRLQRFQWKFMCKKTMFFLKHLHVWVCHKRFFKKTALSEHKSLNRHVGITVLA